MQAALTAIHGGILAVPVGDAAPRAERVETDPARVEECLLFVDTGLRPGGDATAAAPRAEPNAAPEQARTLAAIATGLRDALSSWRYADVPRFILEEWRLRAAAPGGAPAELAAIAAAAAGAGGAARPCGRAPAGLAFAWVDPDGRRALEASLKAGGFRTLPLRVDLRGLEVV
jgi:hypothetical protein